MKPGYKTTEFWISLGTSVVGLLVLSGVLTPDKSSEIMVVLEQALAVAMIILPQFGYTLSRGKAKSATGLDMSSFIPDMEEEEDSGEE